MMTRNLLPKISLAREISLSQHQSWDGINQRQVFIHTKKDASFEGDWNPIEESHSSIFFKLLPIRWLIDCYMHATSEAIVENGGHPITECEFKTYIGLWILMATCCGWSKTKYLDSTPYHPCANPVPFHFSQIISKTFNNITSELQFT